MQPAVEAEVLRTIALYCQTVDDGRFEEFAGCWTLDAELRSGDDVVQGREAIRAWMERAQPPQRRGTHVTVNTVVDVLGPTEANAASDFLFLSRTGGTPTISVTGRYLDRFAPVDGRWLFASREIVLRR